MITCSGKKKCSSPDKEYFHVPISHISVYLLFKANIFLCVNLVHCNVRVSLAAQDFSNENDNLNLMIRVQLLKKFEHFFV